MNVAIVFMVVGAIIIIWGIVRLAHGNWQQGKSGKK